MRDISKVILRQQGFTLIDGKEGAMNRDRSKQVLCPYLCLLLVHGKNLCAHCASTCSRVRITDYAHSGCEWAMCKAGTPKN